MKTRTWLALAWGMVLLAVASVMLVATPCVSTVTNAASPLETLWKEKIRDLGPPTKENYGRRWQALETVFSEASDGQVQIEFQRLLNSQADFRHESEFERRAVAWFVLKLAKEKNRGKLLSLLSKKCPHGIGMIPIEYYLAFIEQEEGFERGFDLLFEAYEQCRIPKTKAAYLSALESAFPNLRKQEPIDDRAFVELCKRWYAENKDKFRVNPNYRWWGDRFPDMDKPDDLFIPKENKPPAKKEDR